MHIGTALTFDNQFADVIYFYFCPLIQSETKCRLAKLTIFNRTAPSSRLPPVMISAREVSHFWCLIDNEQHAFAVRASLEWNVYELMKAIKQERAPLESIDIEDIVLWKVRLSYS